MKKAVIYARYSSHKQREESIERQLEICHKFAEDNDYEIIAEYCDRERTGRNDNRLNFQKMMKDAERKEFEAVIVLKQDRFARKRADSQINKLRLATFNIRVLSATEPIPEGSSGILIESLLEGIAEYYSAELAEKVTDGMRKNILKGTVNGSYRTYGYDIIDKKYVVNPDEADLVKKIFEKYANGDTVKSIIEYCNKRGYKTAQDKEFDYSYIERMLRNKKYIGIYSWADIEKSDSIEAIIEERIFNKVQKRIEENANTGARENAIVDYVLSGKAFCGHCEQPLVADSVTKTVKNAKPDNSEKVVFDFTMLTFDKINELLSEKPEPELQESANKRVYRYYVCRGRKEKAFKNGCHKQRLNKDKLENAVIAYTANQYLCDENIEELAKAIYKVQNRVTSNPNIKEIEYKILEEAKKIENLYVMVESGHFTNKVFERIEQAELRKEDYEKELRRLKKEMPKLTLEQIKEKLGLIRLTMQSYVKFGEIPIKIKKAFCDAFIEKVYVFDDDGDDGNGKGKKTRVKIIFDAFESEGLLGFDDAEIELSSKMETLGSPKQHLPLWVGVVFLLAKRTG